MTKEERSECARKAWETRFGDDPEAGERWEVMVLGYKQSAVDAILLVDSAALDAEQMQLYEQAKWIGDLPVIRSLCHTVLNIWAKVGQAERVLTRCVEAVSMLKQSLGDDQTSVVHLDALLTTAEAAMIPALAEDEDVDLLLEENIVAVAMQGPAEGVVDSAELNSNQKLDAHRGTIAERILPVAGRIGACFSLVVTVGIEVFVSAAIEIREWRQA
jgi:hypothetical protein